MDIRVLQGLNLKHPVTTVVAELEVVKPDLLDFFKELHPIFMVDYAIEDGKVLEVQTHIPYMWKNEECLKALEMHGTGKSTFEEARAQMLEVVRVQIRSMSTIPLLMAAHEKGYETFQYYINDGIPSSLRFNRVFSIGIGQEMETIYASASSKDSLNANKTQRDKAFTNQMIEMLGLPIAKWAVVDTKDDLADAAEEIGFPLVLKPAGLTGGQGVECGMGNLKELEDAWDRTHEYYEHGMNYPEMKAKWQKKIIIQQMLKGEDYRILVVDGRFAVGTHRLQARVTGDGQHTIEELINEENKNPARDIKLPTHTLKPIVIDNDLKNVLSKQDLTIDYVPKKDEVIRVRDVASMSRGGITADVTDQVHPQIQRVCESLACTVKAHVLGVDVLCQDISKPLTLDNGGIIEMNTMPEMYLNIYPVIGRQYPEVPKMMIDGLMDDAEKTRTVVVLGNVPMEAAHLKIREELEDVENLGYLSDGTTYINEEKINTGFETDQAVLGFKRNRFLDTIALHYSTLDEIEENGLGFNEIDLMIADKGALAPIREKIDSYVKKGKIANLITV
jgi:D-alanine-D-alanine ligase-like ATP-grasp enzyme